MNLIQNSGFFGDFYPYGFNGMESDDEVSGEKNSYDFGARIYDPRIGRFLSLDPLAGKFADISPYAAFNNNPIFFVDPTGEEPNPNQIRRRLARLSEKARTIYGTQTFAYLAYYTAKAQKRYYGGIGVDKGTSAEDEARKGFLFTKGKRNQENSSTGWNFGQAGSSGPMEAAIVEINPFRREPFCNTFMSDKTEERKELNLNLEEDGGILFVNSQIIGGFKAELRMTYKDGTTVSSSIGDAPQVIPAEGEPTQEGVVHPLSINGYKIDYTNSKKNPITKMEIIVRPNEAGKKVHLEGYTQIGGKTAPATFYIAKKT